MKDSVYADFHVHTHLSPCGKPEATAGAMLQRARANGIAAMGFADHLTPDPVPGCAFYDGQRPHLLADLRAEIARLAWQGAPEILVGLEADYTLAGESCLDAQTLAQADHVVCAASHFHLPAAPRPFGPGHRAKAELMLHCAQQALVVPGVSIWAHPFDCSRMRPLGPIMKVIAEDELASLIALANEREVAVEINGGPAQLEDYVQATARFFGLAREMGARFTITSDAHHPDDLQRLDLAVSWAQAMGIREQDCLTAQELIDRQRRKKWPVLQESGRRLSRH
jgi:histidinol phosphatase-like PHP family hydrolase